MNNTSHVGGRMQQRIMIIVLVGAFLKLGFFGSAWVKADSGKTEIHGTYRVRGVFFNYASHTPLVSPGYSGPETDAETRWLADQRFRFSIESELKRDVRGVLGFEVGDIVWGLGAHDVGENWGGAQGADVVNVEVRNAYLQFKIPETPVQVKAGIQSPSDGFKGYLFDWDWDFDVAGLETEIEFNSANLTAGWFRLNEGGDFAEADDRDLLKLGLDITPCSDGSLGPYVYFLNDQRSEGFLVRDFWAGASFSKSFDHCGFNGFFIYNSGEREYETMELSANSEDVTNSGFAARLEAKKEFEGFDLSLLGLYSSGEEDTAETDRGDFHVILGPNYANYLELFFPGAEDVAGLNVDLNNGGLGLLAVQARVKIEPVHRVWLSFAGGILQSAAENSNGEKEMGTEVDGVIGYEFRGGMTAELGAAYVLVGDFYKRETTNPDPDNMFEVYSRLQFSF
jgi:hypothetical protein